MVEASGRSSGQASGQVSGRGSGRVNSRDSGRSVTLTGTDAGCSSGELVLSVMNQEAADKQIFSAPALRLRGCAKACQR